MTDILLLEHLRRKGILSELEYLDIILPKQSNPDIYSEFFNNFKLVTRSMDNTLKDSFIDRLKDYDTKHVEHFNESYAKYIVSKMWHIDETGNKCMGEIYDMHKAEEVFRNYAGVLSSEVTCADIYVAINALYHDYSVLFKKWFGEDICYLITLSAITFWFEDNDASTSKLWNYFKDK